MKRRILLGSMLCLAALAQPADAALINVDFCSGAQYCTITDTPPAMVTPDPNDGVFLSWDERQNVTLTAALRIDRVFDPLAAFITDLGNGTYEIQAGTAISSHYVQWDPGNDSSNRAVMTLNLDAPVYGFITSDADLTLSNSQVGLASVDYGSFTNRGLESDDVTNIHGASAVLSWEASTPGEWARIITGPTPPIQTPLPPSALTGAAAITALFWLKRRRA